MFFTAFKEIFPFEEPTFYKKNLEAKLMAVPGIKSVNLTIDIEMDNGDTSVTNLEEYIELPAGYFVYNSDSTITLNVA